MSSQFFYAFMAFFAIMNPISNLPAYMALVADDSQKISRKIAFRSLLIAFVIITVFIFSGDFHFLKYLELQLFLSELLVEY